MRREDRELAASDSDESRVLDRVVNALAGADARMLSMLWAARDELHAGKIAIQAGFQASVGVSAFQRRKAREEHAQRVWEARDKRAMAQTRDANGELARKRWGRLGIP